MLIFTGKKSLQAMIDIMPSIISLTARRRCCQQQAKEEHAIHLNFVVIVGPR